jgi:hypothetical protein
LERQLSRVEDSGGFGVEQAIDCPSVHQIRSGLALACWYMKPPKGSTSASNDAGARAHKAGGSQLRTTT